MTLTSRGAVVSIPRLHALTTQFHTDHVVPLTGFIDHSLLSRIQRQITAARFYERTHGRVGVEACMETNACLGALHFLVNDPVVLRAIEQLTGRHPLTTFVGRVYRLEAGGRHFDSWHTDVGESRTLGMSVNLNAEPYEGGVFEIREQGAAAPLTRIANTGPGDAIVFAIEDGLEHRVTPVKGCVAKTAFAGWFGSDRPYEVPR